MKIDEYITGAKFSDGYKYKLNRVDEYIARQDYIIKKVSGKKIIHLGFADHIEFIKQKIEQGTWMHTLLSDNTELNIGIDINGEAIEYVKNNYNIDHLYYHDITDGNKLDIVINDLYDYMVIPDVIEHIDSPVDFLRKIEENYGKNINEYIITVPNAFRLDNFIMAHADYEQINSDHRYWFTPFTLEKILYQAGLGVSEIQMTAHMTVDKASDIYHLKKDMPMLRDTISVTCKAI